MILMDTTVTMFAAAFVPPEQFDTLAERAFQWFQTVERTCSRFDPTSEVMQLTARSGQAVPVTPLLFQAVQFALAIAELSDGAFDPTVGQALENRGFNRHYVSGASVRTVLPSDVPITEAGRAHTERPVPISFRDIRVDASRQTITLMRPLILDLGAVVKGLAIDLAAKELAPLGQFSIDAGGDIYVAGRNQMGGPWRVGIRHPRRPETVAVVLALSDQAVCTSGDYERPAPTDGHHIIDPRSGQSPAEVASVTVVAPNAMLADALSTAVFVLGPDRGLRLLASQGLDGLLLSPTLERRMTAGMGRYLA
ncbi:MAG: FAD:protein FMN transferase [Chloroflexota bacterium]